MSLTCLSCRVLFSIPDLQRDHYKCDWHRYNLKRKIANLEPVTKEEFELRAANYKTQAPESAEILTCEVCRKKFASKNSLSNHFQSKKHAEMISKNSNVSEPSKTYVKTTSESKIKNKPEIEIYHEFDDDEETSDWESCDDEDDDINMEEVEIDDSSIPSNTCLFCSHESPTLEENVKHMTVVHSFFIPDFEYLHDLEGLITYLGHKVGNGNMCLWCCRKGKRFKSSKAAQRHMLDKGHCKILHEGKTLLSYSDFYDYSASHPDTTDENIDEEVALELLDSGNYELVLPSGATIGHRSLALYYKQNLRQKREKDQKALDNISNHYKSLGWTGTSGSSAILKAKDLNYMQRIKSKYALKLSVQKNKLQPHFRQSVLC